MLGDGENIRLKRPAIKLIGQERLETECFSIAFVVKKYGGLGSEG